MAYLKVIFPRHVIIFVGFGCAISSSGLLLEWRCGVNLVIRTGSLALFHLDKARLGERRGEGFDGRHQSCGTKEALVPGGKSLGRSELVDKIDGAVQMLLSLTEQSGSRSKRRGT